MSGKKKDLNKTKPKRLRGDFIQWKVEATPPLPNPSNEKKVIVNTCVCRGGRVGSTCEERWMDEEWEPGGSREKEQQRRRRRTV